MELVSTTKTVTTTITGATTPNLSITTNDEDRVLLDVKLLQMEFKNHQFFQKCKLLCCWYKKCFEY